ncbi:serine/threonine protein kinase [Marinitenerispora sediminis]|uniref:non-specific serine/threonine protein kinase n=1 Tax=Marinitenerispora sediminis TaxID=1931232 RepID=A0A368T088_9ACTN|nr:serine/threonine-protein kinase [Marinitenerispora sediminis]RCV48035.1 phosphotransferase [Marinitenerispora sediminis]RCV48247.1 phosphotransferase [Marinitenerispora sediminis]RCV51967.1 phosphotransferase [Marinitenerispora sediminis]
MGPLENGDPERIGRYRLIGRLGAGGMGQVFFGRSAGGRAVAVKRIHPHMATDPSFRQRFAREVTAARQVSGAFTAPVIDADPDGEVPWLVTSYVPSLPLDEAVRALGPLPEPSLRVLAAGLAEALTEIHRVGLIHRDLKPGNVLLAEDGPRVIDFGIARATSGTAATQSIIGTPGFMSPEQIQGEALTPKSDMFAYGAVLVYAASGIGPFGEGAMPTLVMRILQHEPDISAVPPSLQRLVAACLAKDERGRPGPGDVLDALGDVEVGSSWLPPTFMRGVQEQVARVNAALAGGGGTDGGATVALGAGAGAAAGAAATQRYDDQQATRAATQHGVPDATSVMGAESGRTAGYPAAAGSIPSGPQAAPTAAMPPTGAADRTRGDESAYSDLYRGSPRDEERRRAEQERRRREEEELRRRRAEERRREEWERERERRREHEAEQAHRERVRAEREAARRAEERARMADQPGLWSFVKVLPLLVIPLIQIPLGWGVSHAWSWFTLTEGYWGSPWYYEGILTESGFFHALYLGYFLLNNVVSLEYLVRSLRTGFATGAMLAGAAIAGTNGALWYFGFFG